MAYQPPPAQNYPSPLIAYPSVVDSIGSDPPEGKKCIPCEIDWGTFGPSGGQADSIYVNFQNNATLEIKNIKSLLVDNSECGADVVFYFPDIPMTYTIPSYTPYALVPVLTGQKQFYVVSLNAEAEDITRFQIINYVPPPMVIPTSQEQNFDNVGGIDMGTASTAIIPAGISGTLESAWIFLAMAASNTGAGTWKLEDGAGNIIAQGEVQVSSGNKYNVTLLALYDVKIRFINGINMINSQSAVLGGTEQVNLYYRTP